MTHGWFEAELLDTWQASRIALSNGSPSRYDRLQWTTSQFVKAHPEQPRKLVYLELDTLTRGY